MLIAVNSLQSVIEVKKALGACFDMENCGEAKLFLGIKISGNCSVRTLNINQEHYISKVLSQFRMEDCKSAPTPVSNQIDETVL